MKSMLAPLFLSSLLSFSISCRGDDGDSKSPEAPQATAPASASAEGSTAPAGAENPAAPENEDANHAGHAAQGAGAAVSGHSVQGKTHSQNNLFLVSINWSENLEAGTLNNTAKVHFNSLDGEHVPATLKSFKLFMVSMGHGSIKEKSMTFTQLDEAHWQVGNIYFSMPGPAGSWVVDLEAEVNGQVDTARVSIDHEVH